MKAVACSVSVRTPTPGDIVEIDTAATTITYIAQNSSFKVDTDKAALAYHIWDGGAGDDVIKAVVITASGTTITVGALNTVSTHADALVGDQYYPGLIVVDTTHLAVVAADVADAKKGSAWWGIISGTMLSFESAEYFSNAIVTNPSGCLLSTSKIVVSYKDDADVNDVGEVIVATTTTGGTVGKINGVDLA